MPPRCLGLVPPPLHPHWGIHSSPPRACADLGRNPSALHRVHRPSPRGRLKLPFNFLRHAPRPPWRGQGGGPLPLRLQLRHEVSGDDSRSLAPSPDLRSDRFSTSLRESGSRRPPLPPPSPPCLDSIAAALVGGGQGWTVPRPPLLIMRCRSTRSLTAPSTLRPPSSKMSETDVVAVARAGLLMTGVEGRTARRFATGLKVSRGKHMRACIHSGVGGC